MVALALQVGVNYANDYSDGVRGTDTQRRGPVRLTATGLATPRAVRNRGASIAFAVAAVVGAVLSLVVNPWLLLVGVAAIAAAVTYTGGPKPYGYSASARSWCSSSSASSPPSAARTCSTRPCPGVAWVAALAVGLPACGILLANNVRDVDTDRVAGKRTLAVRLGRRARSRPVRRVRRGRDGRGRRVRCVRRRLRCSRCSRCRSRSRRCARC